MLPHGCGAINLAVHQPPTRALGTALQETLETPGTSRNSLQINATWHASLIRVCRGTTAGFGHCPLAELEELQERWQQPATRNQ
jgi:hypothetical protein